MKRPLLFPKLAMVVAVAVLTTSTVSAQSVPHQHGGAGTLKMHKRVVPPHGPKKFSAGPNQSTADKYEHDSDKQLDIWVKRCNKAGGGMELGDDGNYRCVGTDGKDIDNW